MIIELLYIKGFILFMILKINNKIITQLSFENNFLETFCVPNISLNKYTPSCLIFLFQKICLYILVMTIKL